MNAVRPVEDMDSMLLDIDHANNCYIFRDPSTGLYKIGVSLLVKKRFRELRSFHPGLEFIGAHFLNPMSNARIFEARWHYIFRTERIPQEQSTEWFKLTEQDVIRFLGATLDCRHNSDVSPISLCPDVQYASLKRHEGGVWKIQVPCQFCGDIHHHGGRCGEVPCLGHRIADCCKPEHIGYTIVASAE